MKVDPQNALGVLGLGLAIGLVLVVSQAGAVRTSTWKQGGTIDFGDAESVNVALTADGSARLAPKRETVADPGQAYIWCLLEGPDGAVYAGTGDDGRILKITPAGDTEVYYDSVELQILSLAIGPDGALYAGGAPDGVILRIDAQGATTYFDTPEGYVWALEFGEDGALYAATGDRGILYRVSAAGVGEVYYDSDEVHLLTLDQHPDGWLVGSSPDGVLMQVVTADSARVLFDAPEEEIKAIAAGPDGTVFFGAVGAPAPPAPDGLVTYASGAGSDGRGASVYRLSNDGAVERFWRATENLVLALAPTGDGGLWVGTGDQGGLVRLDARGTAVRLFETAESQVLSVVPSARLGVLVGTGNLARVYRVGPEVEGEGFLHSEIFDARNVAAWGRMSWQAEIPAGTALRVQTRTGNTAQPDATWSAWSAELRDMEGAPIPSPPARFIQWRARLLGAGSQSPVLESVSLAYLEYNLPPRLHAVDVVAAEGDLVPSAYETAPDRVQQTLPTGVQVEFAFPNQPPQTLRLGQVAWLRSTRVASWVAEDPNDDQLAFDVFIRGEQENTWTHLAEALDQQIYAFPTAELADGRYQLKVKVSDRPSNPLGWDRADSLTSRPFVVDNTPPAIDALRAQRLADGAAEVSAVVIDRHSLVDSFEYSTDAENWRQVFPEDAIFDTREESFRFQVETEDGRGELTIMVRATDTAGNAAARRVAVP